MINLEKQKNWISTRFSLSLSLSGFTSGIMLCSLSSREKVSYHKPNVFLFFLKQHTSANFSIAPCCGSQRQHSSLRWYTNESGFGSNARADRWIYYLNCIQYCWRSRIQCLNQELGHREEDGLKSAVNI